MALKGAESLQQGSKLNAILAQIHNFIAEKKFKELYAFIKDSKQASFAGAIYQVLFANWLPGCWLAFLRNPHLNTIIEQKHLIAIIGKASEAICHEHLAQENKKYYHLVLVAIARNAEWCRMLSYRFFLNYVSMSRPLMEHVIYDIEFMTHLDYVHMGMLFDQIIDPEEQNVVLEYLEELLDGKSPLHGWALESVKYMAIHCHDFNRKVQAAECETIMKMLTLAFHNDRFFASEVLKRSHLYQLFDLADQQAYLHPLLSMDDYVEIMMYLREKAPMLAYHYSLLEPSRVIQEEQSSEIIVEGMMALSLSDRAQSVVVESVHAEPTKLASKYRTSLRRD